MNRYSIEELHGEKQEAEGTAPGSRRVGIVIAVVGVLMIALSMLEGGTYGYYVYDLLDWLLSR